MTVRVYKSTDDGAPVLNGLAGSLITVLDAVLVNGYGTMAAAGWTKPFSGTNKAVYRSSTTNGGSGLYYQVLDNNTSKYSTVGSYNSRLATVRGYETMSSVDTGTNAFLSGTSQSASTWHKSFADDSTSINWTIIADQYTAYVLIDFLTDLAPELYFIGEFFSYKPNFLYKGIVRVHGSETADTHSFRVIGGNTTGNGATYIPRDFYENITGNSTACAFVNSSAVQSGTLVNGIVANYNNGAAFPYPHPIDGKLHLSKIFIGTNDNVPLGYLRGIYAPLHIMPLNNLDVFYGTGSLSGKTFQLFNTGNPTAGRIAIEISDTWSYSV